MAVKKYAGLDTNYLPTDGSVPVALGSEAIELTVTSGSISQAVSLQGYDKIAFVTEGGTNTSIDFLELIGSESTDATLEIVKDISASSGYALKLTGTQKLVFGTRISYVPNILKKITLKAKKDSGNTGNLYASVMSYANGQYINKSGNISIEDYVSVVDTSSLTTSYTTNIGYIKDTGTNYIEPASNPNSPSELPATTDEIALVLESTGASDIWYIDVISLEEVENSIRDIPDGQGVYDSSQNFNTRNDRIATTPANPVVTTPSTYTLNGDGSIDITFTWTYTGTGNAYNIDGFGIYTYSSGNSTPPTFTDSAVYVDATTRNFTLYGITINKYYTIGVQAYRQVDHDIAVGLSLSEDVIRSSIVQSTPYRPVNITPSTTSYAIQRNVGSYLGSDSLGSIYIHGYYPNGMRGDIAGQILYNEGSSATDMYLAINAQAVDCTDFTYTANKEYKCYLVLNAGVVKPAIYDINTNTFVNDTETVSTGVVIGYVIVDYTHSGTVYTIKDAYVYESAKLLSMSKTTKLEEAWQYLSEATNQSDWESRVDDLGIENSFTFLAAYNAFIENLNVGNITAGAGDGTAGSGFRFRAMSDRDMDDGNIPVFDVMYDNKKLFEVVATGTDAGDVIIGDYTNGNGIKYDKSAGKFSVKGTVEAGSSVPYSTVTGGPPANADNTSTFIASGTAFQTANGKFKVLTNGSIKAVDGKFKGALTVESDDSTYVANIDKTNGIKQTKNGVTTFHAKPDGDVMLGNYNPSTKTGGIYYDKSEDKLLGNVAYDQWDLVIQSDSDLALLTTGTTTYENVLIAPGTYNINAQLDLSAHGVKQFVGCGVNQSVLNINYVLSTHLLKVTDTLIELGNFRITSNKTQTSTSATLIYAPSAFGVGVRVNIHDIKIDSMSNKTIGIGGGGGYDIVLNNIFITNCYSGFIGMAQLNSCYAVSCASIGFGASSRLTNCIAQSCGTGFSYCFEVSSSHAHTCTTGFSYCQYITSSFQGSCTTGWSNCLNIDYDSTNCDQQWTLGSRAINHGVSYVLPRGVYQIYRRSAGVSIFLEAKDASTWYTVGDVFTGGGYVASDGTNMRLLNNSEDTNCTVYWRKKP